MSLLTYITAARFTSTAQHRLKSWYRSFDHVDFWEFIRQNIDRECLRNDIDTVIWDEFLDEVAAQYPARAHPLDTIKGAIDARAARFFLPGKTFIPNTPTLYRYMLLDQFMKHNYKGRVTTRDMAILKTLIDRRYITGADMEGTTFGKQVAGRSYAVWCADDSLASESDGEKVRDRVGLKHVTGGYLVEISYTTSLLDEHDVKVRPPTVPDAFAEGADNWIWVKNRNPGGPDWGYTVDMSAAPHGAEGVPEALHEPFRVAAGDGAQIGVRALTPFSRTPPQMDHQAMLSNLSL